MRRAMLLLFLIMFIGCVHYKSITRTSDFQSYRLKRELNFYVACHPLHKTNCFYVFPIELNHGELIEANVYWREEQTLLSYSELVPNATHDSEAWGAHELKLGRDTVDTEDEIGGSDYLVTRDWWIACMERCISKGKLYQISLSDAERVFPNETNR